MIMGDGGITDHVAKVIMARPQSPNGACGDQGDHSDRGEGDHGRAAKMIMGAKAITGKVAKVIMVGGDDHEERLATARERSSSRRGGSTRVFTEIGPGDRRSRA